MTGSGTLLDPYVIYNAIDLQNVETNLASHYILNNDINCSGIGNFLPLGQSPAYFSGTFDGKGYTISNLTVDRPAEDYVGLFGITDGATIQNVTLDSPSIHGHEFTGALIGLIVGEDIVYNCHIDGGSVIGDESVGGMVGYAVYAAPTLIIITDCDTSCSVTSDMGVAFFNNYVGGFLGYASGILCEACFSTGAVVGIGGSVGGFIGHYIYGNTNACFSSGAVSTGNDGGDSWCGGFVGWSNGDCDNCYSRSSVTATGDLVGGFAGVSGQETNCYSTGAVSGVGVDVGGFCGVADTVVDSFWDTQTSGQAASDGGTGKTTAQMKIKSTFTGAGWDFISIWGITRSVNSGYPHFGPSLADQGSVDQTVIGNKVSLEAIRNLEIVYGGRFYINKSGLATYESRYHRNV